MLSAALAHYSGAIYQRVRKVTRHRVHNRTGKIRYEFM